jgi:hypothetical protein
MNTEKLMDPFRGLSHLAAYALGLDLGNIISITPVSVLDRRYPVPDQPLDSSSFKGHALPHGEYAPFQSAAPLGTAEQPETSAPDHR